MIKQKLQTDQITALKAKDQKKLNILRYILAQIKNKEIEKRSDLTDEEIINVLRKISKELNESIEAFIKGKREDLVADYKNQLVIVSPYLPQEISDQELKKEIEKIIAENQEVYQSNPKAIIGVCVKQLKNKADPARIIKMFQSLNSNKRKE